MRAIGKGSLASILAAGLHVARIIIIVAFVGLSIAMVVVPFVPLLVAAATGISGVEFNGDVSVEAADFLGIAHHFVNFAVILFVVNRLLEILKTLRFGSPFVKENAERFRTVGWALMIGEGAKFAFGFLSLIFDADLDVNLSFIAWLAITAVFVLAEVFREGARMKEEQDLTV